MLDHLPHIRSTGLGSHNSISQNEKRTSYGVECHYASDARQAPLAIRDIDPPDLRVDRPAAPRAGGEVVNLNEVIQPAAPIAARELVETAVRDLAESGSFSTTHVAIRDLKPLLSNLTKDDVETLFRAAIDNNQIRWILSDEDVADLYLSLINAWVTNVNVDLAEDLIEQMGLSPEEPENPQ